ncbi:MAG TPA: hypothetical protein VFB55_10970 [Verrucomicrobiae bacterium]|nr:hypothetical protein [Verrucomicrobiae bacterium]
MNRLPGEISLLPTADGRLARSPTRWLALIALVFAAHVVLIFAFGDRKPIVPRPVRNVPHLQLVDAESVALDDPTVFALPHARDAAAVGWKTIPAVPQPRFRWTEPPQFLPAPADLGAAFEHFLRTNSFAAFTLDFKPPPKWSRPQVTIAPDFPSASELQIVGDLARRPLIGAVRLPTLALNSVIAPSRVAVVVDAAGNVVSAVLLPPANAAEAAAHVETADAQALSLARTLRFAPAERATFGELIFRWRTVPVTAPHETEPLDIR